LLVALVPLHRFDELRSTLAIEVRVNSYIERFITKSEIIDLLDAITVIYHFVKHNDHAFNRGVGDDYDP
jgi:hypothetical protein